MTARLGALALVAATLFVPIHAHADAAAARFHDARARRLYGMDRYEEAIAEFFLAHRHAPNAGTLFNIALCFQLLRRWDEAFLHYSEYLESAEDDDPRRAQARDALAEIEPRVARVRVETSPPGATIYVDNLERGSYGESPRLLALPEGEREIQIRLDGYLTASRTVEAVTGELRELRVELTPITGTLAVQASVDATVTVRDAEGAVIADGRTPFEAAIAPGAYELEVDADGYVAHRELVSLERDERATRRVRLVPATGALTVTSNVRGSVVEIDGRPVGFTPVALTDVPTGERHVEVVADGRDAWTGDVHVTQVDRAWLTVSLEEEIGETHSDVTWILGGIGIGLLATGAVFGGLALERSQRFHSNPSDMRNYVRDEGLAFNYTADASFIVGGAALAVSLITFIVEESVGRRRSSANVTRGAR